MNLLRPLGACALQLRVCRASPCPCSTHRSLRRGGNGLPGRRCRSSRERCANGDTDVSVTRETILYFSNPLAADALLSTNNFFAMVTGRRLLTRIELSSDRRKASLFYLEPVPGSSQVTVPLDTNNPNTPI